MRADDENWGQKLNALLGDEGYLALLEAHGGLRLYIPLNAEHSNLSEDIGTEAAKRLSEEYGRDYIRVPLARDFRALQYRLKGWNNRQIASRLCLTESGVERLFQKLKRRSPNLVPPAPRPKRIEKENKTQPKPASKRAVINLRSDAIKAFFLDHALSAPRYRPQQHLVSKFNEVHTGRYSLTRSAGYHWYRWALEALRREQ